MMLITGSKGFVASAFIKRLKSEGYYDILEYDLPTYDILEINNLELRYPIDMIVHFAAIADLNESLENQDKNFEVNIKGTYEVAKFCVKNNIPLIFISTCCVYHSIDDVIDETTFPLTNEPYACSKMAGEYILRGLPELQYCILRIGTVYGEGMRRELFNRLAFEKIMNDERIKVNGDGTQTRTYIYIDDLIDGIYKACEKFKDIRGEIINLCGDEHISVNQTMTTAAKLTGKNYMAEYGFKRYGDFQKENVSIEKAERLLRWTPQIDYKTGMRKTYEWLKTCLK